MIQRTFEFSEGASNKFWTIQLNGKAHTVNFGRIGTAGTAQTKEFASDAEAQKSFDKLIAEKVKKGYVERPTGAALTPVTPTVAAAATTPKPTSVEPKAIAPTVSPKPEPAPALLPSPSNAAPEKRAETPPALAPQTPDSSSTASPEAAPEVRSLIELEDEDCVYVTQVAPFAKIRNPAPRFDRAKGLELVRTKMRVTSNGWHWDFSRAFPDRDLDPEEAAFWLAALTMKRNRNETPETIAQRLQEMGPNDTFPEPDFSPTWISPWVMKCLAVMHSADGLSTLLLNPKTGQGESKWSYGNFALREGFRRHVWPYLTAADFSLWKAKTKALWDAAQWPTDFYASPPPFFFYAAMFGLHDEIAALVDSWPDDRYVREGSWDHTYYHCPQEVVLGLGSAERVAAAFRRLSCLSINLISSGAFSEAPSSVRST